MLSTQRTLKKISAVVGFWWHHNFNSKQGHYHQSLSLRKAIWRISKLEIWNLKSAVSALCGCLSFACFEKKWGKVSWIFQNSSIRHITNTFSYDMPTTLFSNKLWIKFLLILTWAGEKRLNFELWLNLSSEFKTYKFFCLVYLRLL